MATFLYEAFTRNGESTSGSVDALTEADARASLRGDGLLVLELRQSRTAGIKNREFRIGSPKVKMKDIAWAARNLATTQSAGLPVVRALRMLGRQRAGSAIGESLIRIHDRIVNGSPLADAFRAEEERLTPLTTAMIEAGESNGRLDASLGKLADLCEARVRLRRKIVSAMAYPVVMVVLVVLIFVAMLLFVVPTFKGLYTQVGGELPWLTSTLMSMSDFARHNVLIVLGVFAALFFGLRQVRNSPQVKSRRDEVLFKLPVFGELFRAAAVARLSTTMASSLGAGVPLLDALRLAGNVANNEVLNRSLEAAREQVRDGSSLAMALENKPAIPDLFAQLIAVGEETGRVDELLLKYSTSLEDEVEAKVDGLTSVLEPMMIVIFGAIIGVMVIALYLPLIRIFNYLQ